MRPVVPIRKILPVKGDWPWFIGLESLTCKQQVVQFPNMQIICWCSIFRPPLVTEMTSNLKCSMQLGVSPVVEAPCYWTQTHLVKIAESHFCKSVLKNTHTASAYRKLSRYQTPSARNCFHYIYSTSKSGTVCKSRSILKSYTICIYTLE